VLKNAEVIKKHQKKCPIIEAFALIVFEGYLIKKMNLMIITILYIISFFIIIIFVSHYIQSVCKILPIKKIISQYKLYGLCFLGQDKNADLKTIVNLLFLIKFSITISINMNEVNHKKQEIKPEIKSLVLCDLPFY